MPTHIGFVQSIAAQAYGSKLSLDHHRARYKTRMLAADIEKNLLITAGYKLISFAAAEL
jgi:hypothetical protein